MPASAAMIGYVAVQGKWSVGREADSRADGIGIRVQVEIFIDVLKWRHWRHSRHFTVFLEQGVASLASLASPFVT